MKYPHIYLASASPRRHDILNQIGVEHDILRLPPVEGEDEPRLAGESPADYVVRTARDKALRGRTLLKTLDPSSFPARPVLGADTTVILGDDILGKPVDSADAAKMLRRLAGREHEVRTAVTIATEQDLHTAVSVTTVRFCELSDNDIADYCATGEPMGKAGAYGIQGRAGLFVERISGSFTGVMGLPVYETGQLLRKLLR